MIQLDIDDKVVAYGTLLELENRAQEFEALVTRLKDQVLNQSTIFPPEVVASLDDLVWQLRRSAKLIPALERIVGVERTRRSRPPSDEVNTPDSGIRGTIRSIGVAELLGLLSNQNKTGTLVLKTGEETFYLELCEGAVVHASTNRPLPDQRLGTILVAQNKVSAERLEAALAAANDGGPIGETMLRAELVSEEDLRDALEHQVQELFHRIYALEDARFVFRDGAVSEVEKRVCFSTTQLLLESARCRDEEAYGEEVAEDGQDEVLDEAGT
ncbi:MAG: DUF4388 domain-containing protein, partial [Planctomycetes bacterium]|nr:DUF4388 domain-containing protein [Planctomycetota bacterium]